MTYFVFSQTDKGGCFIEPMDKDALEKALAVGGEYHGWPILDQMPDWERTQEGIVIIKGEIIVPQAVAVVTEFRIP